MSDFITTRFCQHSTFAFGVGPQPSETGPCLLVRIYPVDGIEKPLELSSQLITIGRDPSSTLCIADDSVSRRHADIQCVGATHEIRDLGSTNGTFVNDVRVQDRAVLSGGDRVRVGNQIFKYLSSQEVEAQYHEVIFKLMTTDALTSAHSKRYFLETLEREIKLSRRSHSPICVMMLDLDHFKSVNDTYGHLAGDAVLVEFAKRIRAQLRSGDLLARYGGEEFAMLLTRTTLSEAAGVAERIRQATSASPVECGANAIPISVSIGICVFDGHSDRQPDELLALADEQLYRAKRGGRNQVQFSQGTHE